MIERNEGVIMDVSSFVKKNESSSVLNKIPSAKKILVVEDDKNMTVLLSRALEDICDDIEMSWAESLEQAVHKLVQHTDINHKMPYDLIIADIFLEGNGTGLDLYKVINRTYPDLPFLVISSLSYNYINEALVEEKIDNLIYLQKPFLFSQCKEKIKKYLLYESSL